MRVLKFEERSTNKLPVGSKREHKLGGATHSWHKIEENYFTCRFWRLDDSLPEKIELPSIMLSLGSIQVLHWGTDRFKSSSRKKKKRKTCKLIMGTNTLVNEKIGLDNGKCWVNLVDLIQQVQQKKKKQSAL